MGGVRALPRTVYVLGMAALLNDAASEMVAPLWPVFVTGALGASPLVVGLIEGLAETAAGVLRVLGGVLLDRGVAAGGLVRTGYALSNVGRPLLAVMTAWPMVMLVRVVDRLGKGLRSAPRDALIATSVTHDERGMAFGVQRSMDHAGAVIGPLLAAGVLGLGMSVPAVFALSAIPGCLLLLMLWRALPAKTRTPHEPPAPLRFSTLDARLWGLLVAVTLLAFASVPEAFMMIYAREHGLAIAALPLLWAAMSVAKMLVAIPAGLGADRYGRMPMLALAWSSRVAVLAMLARSEVSQTLGMALVLVISWWLPAQTASRP